MILESNGPNYGKYEQWLPSREKKWGAMEGGVPIVLSIDCIYKIGQQ
jgi:hypothetical protein